MDHNRIIDNYNQDTTLLDNVTQRRRQQRSQSVDRTRFNNANKIVLLMTPAVYLTQQ